MRLLSERLSNSKDRPPRSTGPRRNLATPARDYILKNYLALYVEDCRRQGKEPKDMVFAATK